MLLSYLCAHGAKLCDMDKAQKQQGRIVLSRKKGWCSLRPDRLFDHPSIVLLLSQDGQVKMVYVRHPKPTREYTLPEGYLSLDDS